MSDVAPTSAPVARDQRATPGALAVSVVIPHYDDLANLENCLALLAHQTLSRDQFEVIVADNNSRCGLEAVQRVCADRAVVVAAPIQGAGEARNAGAAASRGATLAFIDSDCRPRADWLERGLAAMGNGDDVVGGRVEVDVEDPERLTAVEAYEKVFAFNFERYIEKKGFSGSGNLFVRRATFDAVGGFRVGPAEDMEWSRRATRSGHKLRYARDVVVSHPARRNWSELIRKWRRITREGYLLMIEQPHGRLLWFARSFLVLASPLAQSFQVLRSPKLHTARERWAAIRVLLRLRLWRFVECQRLLVENPR